MDYLKLNSLQNDAEIIQARVANPRQPLWLFKTRASGEYKPHEAIGYGEMAIQRIVNQCIYSKCIEAYPIFIRLQYMIFVWRDTKL